MKILLAILILCATVPATTIWGQIKDRNGRAVSNYVVRSQTVYCGEPEWTVTEYYATTNTFGYFHFTIPAACLSFSVRPLYGTAGRELNLFPGGLYWIYTEPGDHEITGADFNEVVE